MVDMIWTAAAWYRGWTAATWRICGGRPEQVEQGTQPRPSGNSAAPTMKRPGDHALSPEQMCNRWIFKPQDTQDTQEFRGSSMLSTGFFVLSLLSAGFPTQTQQASTWKRSQSRFTEELGSLGFAVAVYHWYVWASATFPVHLSVGEGKISFGQTSEHNSKHGCYPLVN